MLVDANLLVFAVNEMSRFHIRAAEWLQAALSGERRLGIAWPSVIAFVRLTTNPRVVSPTLSPDEAWDLVERWLGVPSVWVPLPTDNHAAVLGRLIARHQVTGNLVTDAHLAAIAIEHGLEIYSADTDFARFTEVRWVNPIAT